MKIVFFSGGIERSGGTEKALCNIASGLAERNYEVLIVSLTGSSIPFFKVSEKVRIISAGAVTLTGNIVANIRFLKNLVNTEKPDIWIDVDIILGVYSLILKSGNQNMKLVSWDHFNFDHKFERLNGIRKVIRRLLCRFSDSILVLTKSDNNKYTKKYRLRHQINQIYNPVDIPSMADNEDKENIILSMGWIERVKGFDRLLKAWERIYKDLPDWKVIIVGEGSEKERLIKYVSENNIERVEFMERTQNPGEYYRRASIYALPSRSEGFPMVLLEAMSYGVPCVAFLCSDGIGELISNDVDGILVGNDDIEGFSNGLTKLVNDGNIRDNMRHIAQNRAEDFKTEVILDQWEEMLAGL